MNMSFLLVHRFTIFDRIRKPVILQYCTFLFRRVWIESDSFVNKNIRISIKKVNLLYSVYMYIYIYTHIGKEGEVNFVSTSNTHTRSRPEKNQIFLTPIFLMDRKGWSLRIISIFRVITTRKATIHTPTHNTQSR